jgi:hypothetical protein
VRPPTRARSRTPSVRDAASATSSRPPEAGYATCLNCAERGFRDGDTVEWWRHDPDSQWSVDEDDEVIDEDVGLTRSGLMGMVGKNIVCDECGESSFRIKQGVDSNRCRHCGNIIEDAWCDDDE